MPQTKRKGAKRNALHCEQCARQGLWADHKETVKCNRYCCHCGVYGHHMSLCYKLKFCNLCGKAGHNPYRCWEYWSIEAWIGRARVLDRCRNCLSLWKFNTVTYESAIVCKHCGEGHKDVDTRQSKESQTTDDTHLVQFQTELQEKESIIEDQITQIEELNSKITALEVKLKNAKASIKELNYQWQSAVNEKEQELHKVNDLDSLCRQKEMELRELREQVDQKDSELEQHRRKSAQPSQTVPPAAQQFYPASASNNQGHINETNCIKATLIDLHDQQEKLSVIVNHLYNKIKTQDMSLNNYSCFNPYMGLWDTGQYFNKLQQV